MVTFKTLDQFDDKILEFRFRVRQEEDDLEFKYWFSINKFEKMNFYNIETALVDNKVIAISGSTIIDESFRICQLLYTLPTYRNVYRDLLIRNDGFIFRHLQTAKKLNINKIFYTMHGVNKKTEQALKVMLHKRHHYPFIRDFVYSGIIHLNNSDQHCFTYCQ
jgi:hypothetical protein